MSHPGIPQVFDPLQRRRARMRAYGCFPEDTRFLHDWATRQIDDRLKDVRRIFSHSLFLPPPILTDDMDHEILQAEPDAHDLITANLWLHTINDLPGMLVQIRRALKPDGLFIGAMLGGETLYELRDALQLAEMEITGGVSPRVSPFADKPEMAALMQRAGFSLPVVDSEIITVTYPTLTKLMHDLRGMGETNILAQRTRKFSPRTLFPTAEKFYHHNHSEPEGTLRASFEIIFLLGWAPHESQQKPLKPGSATARLADILGGEEGTLPS